MVLEKVRKKNKKNEVIRIGLPTFGGPAYKDTIYIEVLEAGKTIYEVEKLYYNLGKEDYYSPTDSDRIPSSVRRSIRCWRLRPLSRASGTPVRERFWSGCSWNISMTRIFLMEK